MEGKLKKGFGHYISVARKMASDKSERFAHLDAYGFYNWMDDEKYLKKAWKMKMGSTLDLGNPKTFNEKLQWLKINDRKPFYAVLADKYAVKEYVADKIGKQYVIPTLGAWKKFDDIDFCALPGQFVLKCTHDSGGLVIVKDKKELDIKTARKVLTRCLKRNFYYVGREWPYKNIEPKIIAEPYLSDGSGMGLEDYKFLCFHGEPKLVEVHLGRFTGCHTQDFYDMEWRKTTITQGSASESFYPKPVNFEKMAAFSRLLASGFAHMRVDWYECKGKLYFGEFTFYDGSGFEQFGSYQDDLKLGSWIQLPADSRR